MLAYRCIVVLGSYLAMPLMTPATFALPAPAAFFPAGPVDGVSTTFAVQEKTEIPGRTLKSGTYTIQILDHLSDRMVLRVSGLNGEKGTLFLALPSHDLAASSSRGPLLLKGNGKSALRGFSFPDGTVAQFVYPKKDAVSIAKANNVNVPAIDPASEGMSSAKDLSKTDMQLVTLWMLTPTQVSPDGGTGAGTVGIQAAKYQAPQAPATAVNATASTRVQGAPAASSPKTSTLAASSTSGQRAQADPGPLADAPKAVKHKPLMAVLPHTAGMLPLVWLAGLLSMAGAMLLSIRRVIARA